MGNYGSTKNTEEGIKMKFKELAEFNALYPEQYPWDTIDNNTLSRATAKIANEIKQGFASDQRDSITGLRIALNIIAIEAEC
jgi:hypothetical protein